MLKTPTADSFAAARACAIVPRLILAVLTGYPLGLAAAGQTPNIVLILADDLGYGDPGCYNDQSQIPTPNIDRLASEGMRFSDAHSPSSVCTPTRYGLLTGRYCWRTALQRSVLWPWDPDLDSDPAEKNNRYKELPAVVQRLEERLERYRQQGRSYRRS